MFLHCDKHKRPSAMFTASLAQIPTRVPVVYQYLAENSPAQAHRFSLLNLFKRMQCLVLLFFFFSEEGSGVRYKLEQRKQEALKDRLVPWWFNFLMNC